MKLNIQKFQYGGRPFFTAVANPFVNDPAETTAASSKTTKKGSQLLSDKTMNELMTKGNPNDVNRFYKMLEAYESQADFGMGINRSQLYALQAYANQVIQQGKYTDKAEEFASKNGSWDEIAVSQRGDLYVQDLKTGQLAMVRLNQYDKTKQRALTIGELLEQRRFAPDLVNNSDVVTTIGNSVGMEKINEYIQDIIKTLGESDNAREFYTDLASIVGEANAKKVTTQEYEAIKGIAKEWKALGKDAIFKIEEHLKDTNVQEGLAYILSVLPRNMQMQLHANWVAGLGQDYNKSDDYVTSVIMNALSAGRKVKHEFGINYQNDVNKAAGTKASTEKTYNMTPLEVFFDGNLNQTDIKITDPSYNNQYQLQAKGVVMGQLTGDNGKAVSNAPLSIALNATISKYLDYNQVYIGDQKVKESQLQNVAYGHDNMATVWMPVDASGEIDWRGFYAYQEAEQKCQDNNITDPQEKNKIHALNGSFARFNAEGKLIQTDGVQQFFLTYGYTTDGNMGDNRYFQELKGDEEDAAQQLIDAIYNKTSAKATGLKSMDNNGIFSDVVKVPIFIKVSPNAASDARIYAGHGPIETNNHTQEEYMVRQQVLQQPLQEDEVITANSQLLYSEE